MMPAALAFASLAAAAAPRSTAVSPAVLRTLLNSSRSSSSHSSHTRWIDQLTSSSHSSSSSSSSSRYSSRSKGGTSTSLHSSQAELVDALVAAGLLTPRAADALRAIDRRWFAAAYPGVPEVTAYQDAVVPITCGQTMPAPSVHAQFLSLLEPHVQPGAAVLDLGAGSGYTAACLAQLAGPSGSVLALEKQPKLVQRALASIRAACDAGTAAPVDVRVCNAMADPPELSGSQRYDAIHVGGSLPAVPAAFVRLLRPGGRLVVALGGMQGSPPQVIATVDAAAEGAQHQEHQEHGSLPTRIAPLTRAQDDNVWSS